MVIDDEIIRPTLAGALSSSRMAGSPKLCLLLTYLVEETLAGRQDRLKGYAIGVEVFERAANFDPSSDPIVRVQMGRLRQALELYYLTDGAADPVQIRLCKGTNVPTFCEAAGRVAPESNAASAIKRLSSDGRAAAQIGDSAEQETVTHPQSCDATAPASAPTASKTPPENSPDQNAGLWDWRNLMTFHVPQFNATKMRAAAGLILAAALFVLFSTWLPSGLHKTSLASAGQQDVRLRLRLVTVEQQKHDVTPFATLFAREMLVKLTKYEVLAVTLAVDKPLSFSSPNAAPGYTVEINHSAGAPAGTLKLSVTSDTTGTVIWSDTVSLLPTTDGIATALPASVDHVIAQITQLRGILLTHLATRKDVPNDMLCILSGLHVISDRVHDNTVIASAKQCLKKMQNTQTSGPMVSALLAELHMAPFDDTQDTSKPLSFARAAVTANPRSMMAMRALMNAQIYAGLIDDGLESGRLGVAQHPANPDMLAAYGTRLIMAGRYEQGLKHLQTAMVEVPQVDPRWQFAQFVGHLGSNNLSEAARIGHALYGRSGPAYIIASTAASVLRGNLGEAQEQLRMLVKAKPHAAANPLVVLKHLRLAPDVERRLRDLVGLVHL